MRWQGADTLRGTEDRQHGPKQRQKAGNQPEARLCTERHIAEIMPYFPGEIT